MRKLLIPVMIILLIACNTSSGNYFRTDKLPNGWVVCPSSRMPPNDRTSWWTSNPLTLTGKNLEVFINDHSLNIHAVVLDMVMYSKEDKSQPSSILTILRYDDAVLAEKDYYMLSGDNIFSAKFSTQDAFIKYDGRKRIIYIMEIQAISETERNIFIELFWKHL